MKKDFLSITDLSADEIMKIINLAISLKNKTASIGPSGLLAEKTFVAIYEKPSLRTRVSFEVAMAQLGGMTISLDGKTIGLGVRESLSDIARVTSSMVDSIGLRVFSHQTIVEFAKYSKVPIINMLSDLEHPCQALADLMTIYENKGRLKNIMIAYVGDGDNNVTNSLALSCAMFGIPFRVASPKGYEISKEILQKTKEYGEVVSLYTDPVAAVSKADVVITDTWVSMGEEAEKVTRLKALRNYQVNKTLMSKAKSDAIFLHCMPVYRGNEVAEDVVEGKQSKIFQEAENRLHVQKALLLRLLR